MFKDCCKDEGIVRNKGKIQAIIQNAQNFKAIEKQYGSFQKYVDSLTNQTTTKTQIKDIVNKFKWLGRLQQAFFVHCWRKNQCMGLKHNFFFIN